MKRVRTLAAASMCLAGLFTNYGSWAQSGEDDWKFQAVIYLYLPAVAGDTTFPSSGGGSGGGASVDPSKILDNLNLAFMGSFGIDKGPWGAFTDVIYLDIGDSESPSRSFTIGGTLPASA